MKVRHNIYVLIGILLFLPVFCMARGANDRIVWTTKASRQTGLYSTKNFFVSQGVSTNISALYYFGDADNEGVAFNGGFNLNNLSLGGGLWFSYNQPIGNHCNMRFALLAGTLRANNELKFNSLNPPRSDYRRFQSIIAQPSVGIQYYPFVRAGLYLYGGVAMTGSFNLEYDFYYMKSVPAGKERREVQGKTFSFLPMIQLGFGYSWKLSSSLSLSAELLVQEGVIDTQYMNLDAWPLAKNQNSQKIELGGTFGTYTDRYGKQQIHWNDGWFQLGITLTYQWYNCEHCRLINNYHNIKPSRR